MIPFTIRGPRVITLLVNWHQFYQILREIKVLTSYLSWQSEILGVIERHFHVISMKLYSIITRVYSRMAGVHATTNKHIASDKIIILYFAIEYCLCCKLRTHKGIQEVN